MMTRTDVANYLGVTPQALVNMAHRGAGPKYAKLSGRLVRYRRSDVEAWIESTMTNTSKPVSGEPKR